METREALIRLAVAALGGLAVGIEREWSARRDEDHSRFGGVRTFLLLGLLGGLSAIVAARDPRLGLAVLSGGLGLVLVAYLVSAWRGTIDATTEVAGVVVLGGGLLAGFGQFSVASAVFASTALVLVAKSRMHAAVERIRSTELEAGARFAVLALVVLPLLPITLTTPLGDLEPRKLWALVLLFAGLSFAGYVALRAAGPGRGYGIAGLLGGLVSSTAVTLNFARESRASTSLARPLAIGALAASAILPLRVLVVSALLEPAVAWALLPALAPTLLLAVAMIVLTLRRQHGTETAPKQLLPANPLRLVSAIQMALFFTLVLWALDAMRGSFGTAGLLGTSALLGLTDLDALTYSMSELVGGGTPAATAVRALLVGMLANTGMKATVALVVGAPEFRLRTAGGLLLFAAALSLGFALG